MKFITDRYRPMQAHIERQVPVAAQHPGFGAARHRGVEMYYLAESVNSGISAAGAMYPQRRGGNR